MSTIFKDNYLSAFFGNLITICHGLVQSAGICPGGLRVKPVFESVITGENVTLTAVGINGVI